MRKRSVLNEVSEIQKSAGLEAPAGRPAPCPVVGVGASAGGLEAFTALLGPAKPSDGLAYVLIQHLDPHHESLLGQLLARKTALPVVTAEDGMRVESDHVYLIPPNHTMEIRNATLRLKKYSGPRGVRRPIDEFLQSLAEDQRDNCACVILSGTGSDGTHGLRAVKTAGGLTLVQKSAEAQYTGMTDSALETGLVDAAMQASEITAFVRTFFDRGRKIVIDRPDSGTTDFLEQVLDVVRARTGHDFSRYKTATLLRRLKRRMQIVGAEGEEAYLEEIVGPGGEAAELFRDLLINVTNFFRDPESFDVLRRDIIPEILKRKKGGDTVRIWCAGCSSGEEPYTVAMLMAEELRKTQEQYAVQIFGTDIDPAMIEIARAGVYPESIAQDIPPELFERYFTTQRAGYAVAQELRDMVRLSDHNLIKDPPFSRLDLIICRNLLIYFSADLQARLLPMLHYSLRKHGYLFIGPSETLGDHADLFEPLEADKKIFKRRDVPVKHQFLLDAASSDGRTARERGANPPLPVTANRVLQERIAERYTLPWVAVGPKRNILDASPSASQYVAFSVDAQRQKLFDLLKEGLRSPVLGLLEDIGSSKYGRLRARDVPVEFDDDASRIDIIAETIDAATTLIVFDEERLSEAATEPDEVQQFDAQRHIHRLEEELNRSRSELRALTEKLETSNEELKSSNEEMMSMNEELQSANEELTTMNDELQVKIRDLAGANADIANYLDATELAILFLEDDGTIRNFTPQARQLFALGEADIGREIGNIRSHIETDALFDVIEQVGATDRRQELSISGKQGDRRYLVRVLPYRVANLQADGVVVTFTEITEATRIAAELAETQGEVVRQLEEIQNIYGATPMAMGLYDRDMRYLRVNERLAALHDVPAEDHVGRTIAEILPDVADHAHKYLQQVFDTGEVVESEAVELMLPHISDRPRVYKPLYYPVRDGTGIFAAGAIIADITKEREMQLELRRVMRELQHRVKNMLTNVLTLVRQARRSDASKDAALDTLSARLKSLAATHDALTMSDWRETELSGILQHELTDVYGEERISVRGPRVVLGPRATLSFGMAIHEMATNAAKYGALADGKGTLDVSWRTVDEGDGPVFQFEWKENGQAIDGPPKGMGGFGTTLIDASIAGTLNGTVENTFEEQGLKTMMRIPLDNLTRDMREGSHP